MIAFSQKIYTVLRQDGTFTYVKEGCCGGTLAIPKSWGLTFEDGDEVTVRVDMYIGLNRFWVLVDNEWKQI